jgi:hypothetical protein
MKTKHVEGIIIARLDEGSNPSGSTITQKATPTGVVLLVYGEIELAQNFGINY